MDALEAYWQVLGHLKNELFAKQDGRFTAKIESSQIKAHILAHPDYAAFKAEHLAKFAAWHTQNDLNAIQPGSRPSELIHQWSESLLDAFKPSSLIEEYDFYQILMDYWAETLQDDVYLIAQDGWPAVKDLAEITKESNEAANLTVVVEETETDKKGKAKIKRISKKYRSEVIAPELIAHRYFSDDLAKLEEKQSKLERLSQELESHLEEHGGEENVLNDVLDAKGKLSAKLLKTALEEDGIEEDERAILQTAQTLMTQGKAAKEAVKTLSEALNLAIFKQFGQLSEAEIKQLVVQDKWLATLQSQIENRLENAIQQLISRLNTLEDRYRSPMAELAQEVEIWQSKVDAHLKNMGFGG
jgi:myosin VC